MTVEELAAFLTVSLGTVQELVASGEIPSAKVKGRRVVSRVGAEAYFAELLRIQNS